MLTARRRSRFGVQAADSFELFVAETRQCSTLAQFQLLDLERLVSLDHSKHLFNRLLSVTAKTSVKGSTT